MNTHLGSDESLFLKISDVGHSPLTSCDPDIDIVGVTRLMKDSGSNGIVVLRDGEPVGMVSVTELRNLIADSDGCIRDRKVSEIMSQSFKTITLDDSVFEAILAMAEGAFHRLVLVNDEGKAIGLVTDTDILSVQTRTPLYLTHQIEHAKSFDELTRIHKSMPDMIEYALDKGIETRKLVELISQVNDKLFLKVAELTEKLEGIYLPSKAAYLLLGSEGRKEQTLHTDQDSAIVYHDDISEIDLDMTRKFAERVTFRLDQIGIPYCEADMIPTNSEWFRSISEWKNTLFRWIDSPTPENVLRISMIKDLRVIYGDFSLEEKMREHLVKAAKTSPYLIHMAKDIVRHKTPLGMFGRLKTEYFEEAPRINLKKGGIFVITAGVALLAQEVGIVGGSTWDKLDQLKKVDKFKAANLEAAEQAFAFLVRLRLQKQIRHFKINPEPYNHVNLNNLTSYEIKQLKTTFGEVENFIKYISAHFRLDLVRN